MLDFRFKKIPETGETFVETSLSGKLLMQVPILNKGTAFSKEERNLFDILGKLPDRVETLSEQTARAYAQYKRYPDEFSRYLYLSQLHDENQVLFYALVGNHLEEMMPIIYTPVIGTAVQQFSNEFRAPRGLFISINDQAHIDNILKNRTHPEVDLLVVTDGSGVLGIGDQGVGGMHIPVGKLMVYTLCAGINPGRVLPIMLDVGTENSTLLNDPFYLGLRQKRVSGKPYYDFMDRFVEAVTQHFPDSFLHWEDFGRDPAHTVLERYKDKHLSFNDDIQGTGVVALAAILAGLKATHQRVEDQRIVIFGAGAAGVGIADQICAALVRAGMSEKEAHSKFWLLNSQGLLLEGKEAKSFHKPYLRTLEEVCDWKRSEAGAITLEEVVARVQPTILIGTSAVPGAFHEDLIKTMARGVKRPIIMPLSNPTERAEAHPRDILNWTQGAAMVATGSPFGTVTVNQKDYAIAQANNALAFPGIGLGVLAVRATRLSDAMLWAACEALAELSPVLQDSHLPLLPSIAHARAASYRIACAVAEQACKEGVARLPDDGLSCEQHVQKLIWKPEYMRMVKVG